MTTTRELVAQIGELRAQLAGVLAQVEALTRRSRLRSRTNRRDEELLLHAIGERFGRGAVFTATDLLDQAQTNTRLCEALMACHAPTPRHLGARLFSLLGRKVGTGILGRHSRGRTGVVWIVIDAPVALHVTLHPRPSIDKNPPYPESEHT